MFSMSERATLHLRLKEAFETQLTVPVGTEPHLAHALAETLQRTGNFIRAQLTVGVARAFMVEDNTGLQLATALEYFHTASLLFDDLPSMDDATHRRGAMCVHHLYGEGPAVLAALALINRAYALLWQALSKLPAVDQAIALAYVERYLGLGGLLNGQSLDLHYAELPASERSPQKIAMEKTVALIRLSLVLPAMAGGASALEIRMLNRLAVFWGLAYQGLDDLRDVLHDSEQAGKTTSRDTFLDRPNLALSLGPAAALHRLHRLVHLADRSVAHLREHESLFRCLQISRQSLKDEVARISGELVGASR